jgi:hypothetical protein
VLWSRAMIRTTIRTALLGLSLLTSACLVTTPARTTTTAPPAPLSGNGMLVGTVTDAATNQPLGRASIEIEAGGGKGTGKNAQSDESGSFTMPELEPGSYGLRCALEGYQKIQQTIQINPGSTTRFDCPMRKQ